MTDVTSLLPSSLDSSVIEYIASVVAEHDASMGVESLRDTVGPLLEDAGISDAEIDELCAKLVGHLGISETKDAVEQSHEPRKLEVPATAALASQGPTRSLTPEPPSKAGAKDKKRTVSPKPSKTRKDKSPARGGDAENGSKGDETKSSTAAPTKPGEPAVVATTQVSRFYLESITTDNKDVDLPGVSLVINNQDYIKDARLLLTFGVHYGLVGRNGTGKSQLLKSIGYGRLLGWPSWVSVLYVEQELVGSPDKDCLESVLEADVEQTRMKGEVKLLEAGLEDHVDADHVSRAVKEIRVKRAERDLQEAQDIADKRSGARGWDARKVLLDKEKRLNDVKDEPFDHAKDISRAQEMLHELYDKLSLVDADEAESRAMEILAGLGFSEDQIYGPTDLLSGGWRMRLALARALFLNVDVLLLDEPSNHLDLGAMLWLQQYLVSRRGLQTVVVVSHDRALLNAVAEHIILIKDKQLKYYIGNFDEFQRIREETLTRKLKQQDLLDKKEASYKAQIERNVALAKKTGDDKRLSQAASRAKRLDLIGLDKTEDGRRYKKSYMGFKKQVQFESRDKEISFDFGEPEAIRHHGPILQLRSISFKYDKAPSAPNIIDGVTLDIDMESRIGIIGGNGAGKTTLLQLVLGNLKPDAGSIERDPRLKIAYFAQHHIDELDLDSTAFAYISKLFKFDKEQEVHDYLGRFGVAGKLALQKMGTLSGGQKARCVLARIMHDGPHVLLLDEPTNHLDGELGRGGPRSHADSLITSPSSIYSQFKPTSSRFYFCTYGSN